MWERGGRVRGRGYGDEIIKGRRGQQEIISLSKTPSWFASENGAWNGDTGFSCRPAGSILCIVPRICILAEESSMPKGVCIWGPLAQFYTNREGTRTVIGCFRVGFDSAGEAGEQSGGLSVIGPEGTQLTYFMPELNVPCPLQRGTTY